LWLVSSADIGDGIVQRGAEGAIERVEGSLDCSRINLKVSRGETAAVAEVAGDERTVSAAPNQFNDLGSSDTHFGVGDCRSLRHRTPGGRGEI
jgi:hypothetical protein